MKIFKLIFVILVFFLLENCSLKKDYINTIQITQVDSISLTNHFLITGIKNNEEIKIISKKKFYQTDLCKNEIKVNQKYKFTLSKINALPIDDSLNMRLYQNGIFINDKSILEKNTEVFTSTNLESLCYVSDSQRKKP